MSDHPSSVRPSDTALELAARWQFAARRRDTRFAWLTGARLAVAVPVACLVPIALSAPLRERIATLLGILDAHALPFAACVAAIAWTWARERRRRDEREHARSWLAAAPISAHDVTAYLRRRAIVDFGVPCAALFAALAVVAATSACDARALLATCAIATVAGFAAGWRSGRHALADAPAPLPRLRHRHAAANANASLGALRRWPFAQWLADAQPRQHARVIAALLLSMPMGITFGAALGIVLFAALALAATGLLRACLAAIGQAGDFLRAAPLPPRAFATALVLRALVAQTAISVSGATIVAAYGAGVTVACAGAAAWLSFCAALCAFALRRERQRGANR